MPREELPFRGEIGSTYRESVYRYFKPPFPRSARAAGSREAVNRAVFGDNLPLSMPFTP